MQFTRLLENLIQRLRAKIRNGELTERGLARRAGLSQSHIHNVLCGARILTPQTADMILVALKISVWELLDNVPGVDQNAVGPAPGRLSLKKPPSAVQRSDRSPAPRKRCFPN